MTDPQQMPDTLAGVEEAISAAVAAGDLDRVARLREHWRSIYAVERGARG